MFDPKTTGQQPPLQHDMHAHWLNKKGKAIRAQLVLASARGLGPANQKALQLGAIIELLHAATLYTMTSLIMQPNVVTNPHATSDLATMPAFYVVTTYTPWPLK